MKRNIRNILGIALLIGMCSSCSKFLDVKPTNAGDAAQSIKTAGDAQVIINGIMRDMTDASYYGRNFIMYGDAKGGDLTIYSAGRGLDALYTFNHTPTTNAYGSYWSTIYYCILQVNNLLDNIDKLQAAGSAENFDNAKGQALTARALMYFDLVRIYGKCYNDDKASFGIPNTTYVLNPFAKPTRTTVDSNYKQILADLTAAAPLISKAKNNGYLNYYGNLAEQARVYLTMNQYDSALNAAETIINSNTYTLYTPSNWVSSWSAQFGTESIFELVIYPGEADLTSGSLGYYLRKKGNGGGSVAGWFGASTGFLNLLNEDPTDVRWGVMGPDELSTTANPRLGSCYKYSGGIGLKGDGKSTATAVNIKVIRLSEIYLIAAEAALQTKDAQKAANYLNQIRQRAPQLAPATAATVSIDMILQERSKELFAEGERYFDMIRLNKSITFDDAISNTLSTPSTRPSTIDRTFYKAVLPIAQSEINSNPALKSQQNPGYN